MVFSSILFLFRFLPVTFLAYYAAPKKLKNLTLRYFPIMLSVILVNFFAGLGIERYRANKPVCRIFLTVSVVFSLGFLAFFKYTDFLISNLNAVLGISLPYLNLTLPLGISFYTFQIMTYTIDVYFGKVDVEHNFIDFGTFVVLFPQLIAGPIVKYSDINRELKERSITLSDIQEGIGLFILGLGSKVLLANSVGALWTDVETIGFSNIPHRWRGWASSRLRYRSISIFPATRLWRSAWEGRWVFTSRRTSTIRTFPAASRNSGDAGI